jgi:hypothetical protein
VEDVEMKHTPGPWTYDDDEYIWIVKVSQNRHIQVEGNSADEAMANCRLIAAAPEMLAELERLADRFGWDNDHTTVKVIAKAKGETP